MRRLIEEEACKSTAMQEYRRMLVVVRAQKEVLQKKRRRAEAEVLKAEQVKKCLRMDLMNVNVIGDDED